MRRFLVGASVSVLAALSGCEAPALLYPDNDIAHSMPLPVAHITKLGMGSGPATVTMPDGEVLTGRYSIDLDGSFGTSSLYASAYGSGAYAAGSGFGMMMSMPNSSPVIVDVVGPKGTTAHCEVMNGNWTGHGNGVCKFSNGATYRLQY